MNLTALFILNVFVSSLLSFLTLIFLCQLFLSVTRIKSPRLRATIRLIPLLKLPLDLLSNPFSKWALAQGINPWLCQEGTRRLLFAIRPFPLAGYAGLGIEGGTHFTIADCLALKMEESQVSGIVILLLAVTALSLTLWAWRAFKSYHYLKGMRKESFVMGSFRVSSMIQTPCACGLFRPTVYFPKALLPHLSKGEIKAVYAHEKAHLRFFDPTCSLILSFIHALFWWIPTGRWIKNLEREQEEACDRAASNPLDLVSALQKGAALHPFPLGVASFISTHILTKRVAKALEEKKLEPLWIRGVKWALVGAIAQILILGSYWML